MKKFSVYSHILDHDYKTYFVKGFDVQNQTSIENKIKELAPNLKSIPQMTLINNLQISNFREEIRKDSSIKWEEKRQIFKMIREELDNEREVRLQKNSYENIIKDLTEEEREKYKHLIYDRDNITNFKISFEKFQFKNEDDMKDKLEKFCKELSKLEYISTKTSKSKDKVYEYEQMGNLKNSIISIHTNTDKPHIHVIYNKKEADKNFNKDYRGLRLKISEIAEDMDLLITDRRRRELGIEKDIEFSLLEEKLTKMSWAIQQNKGESIQIRFKKDKININNVETYLNMYIQKGGSTSFAEKIANNLNKKHNLEIEVEKSKNDRIYKKLIEEKNYSTLIQKLNSDLVKSKPLNEEVKIFLSDNKDKSLNEFKESILNFYRKTSLKSNGKRLYCDFENNKIAFKEFVLEFKEIQKNLEHYILNEKNHLNQQELNKDLKSIDMTLYQFLNIKKTSRDIFLFNNNYNYVKENLSFTNNSIKEINMEIKKLNIDLSQNWVNKISEKLFYENKIRYGELSFDNLSIASLEKKLSSIHMNIDEYCQIKGIEKRDLERDLDI